MLSNDRPNGAVRDLPRRWIDTLFEAMLEGGTDPFWHAVATILLEAFPQDVLVVWEAFNVTLFRRAADGGIAVDRNGGDAFALRAPAIYNALNLSFSSTVRNFADDALARCGIAEHRFLASHRPLHACSIDFLQDNGIHCALVLHGPAEAQRARGELFDRLMPIVRRLFLGVFERQKQASIGIGLSEFFRELPVGLVLTDWFYNIMMVNDEGYRHSVLWNEAPKRSSMKNARARFEIAPDIKKGWDVLRSAWIESLRTGSELVAPLAIVNEKDGKLRATVSIVVGANRQIDTPCFMARFSSVQTRALDDLFDATPQQISVLADLTPAERAVALLVRQGLSNREIAERLDREVWTIKSHLTRIFRKTGARGRNQLIRILHMGAATRK